jgi:hypothetical protein
LLGDIQVQTPIPVAASSFHLSMSSTPAFAGLPAVSVSLRPAVASSASSFVAPARPSVAPLRSAVLAAPIPVADSAVTVRAQADATATAESPTVTIREDVVSIACVAHVDHGSFPIFVRILYFGSEPSANDETAR